MRYIGCHLSAAKGNRAMVRTALSIGANTYAYFTRNPRGSRAKEEKPEDIAGAKEELARYSFGSLVAHGAYTMNLCTKDPEARAFAAQILKEDLQRVSAFDNCFYNFHPGSHVGQGTETGIGYIVSALEQAVEASPDVTVLLETMAGKGSEIGGKFEELGEIIRLVGSPNLGVCLDTCHVWDGGYDIKNNLDGVLDEFDRAVGLDRLKALHVNDSKNPLGSHRDRHACIGEGYLGIGTFAQIINHPVLADKPMILETPNELPGYQREIALLRSLEE